MTIGDAALNDIVTGTNINGAPCPYTLIKGASGAVYVLTKGYKRLITTGAVLDACGYIWSDIITVSDTALNALPTGANVSAPPCPYTRQ